MQREHAEFGEHGERSSARASRAADAAPRKRRDAIRVTVGFHRLEDNVEEQRRFAGRRKSIAPHLRVQRSVKPILQLLNR